MSALLAGCALGADLSGRWTGTFTDDDSGTAAPVYVVLNQAGDKITGTAGPSESHQLPIKTGKVEGDHVKFEVAMSGGVMAFDLTSVGAELKGKMQLSEDGHTANATIVIKRVQ